MSQSVKIKLVRLLLMAAILASLVAEMAAEAATGSTSAPGATSGVTEPPPMSGGSSGERVTTPVLGPIRAPKAAKHTRATKGSKASLVAAAKELPRAVNGSAKQANARTTADSIFRPAFLRHLIRGEAPEAQAVASSGRLLRRRRPAEATAAASSGEEEEESGAEDEQESGGSEAGSASPGAEDEDEEVTQTIMVPLSEAEQRARASGKRGAGGGGGGGGGGAGSGGAKLAPGRGSPAAPSGLAAAAALHQLAGPLEAALASPVGLPLGPEAVPEASLQLSNVEMNGILNDREAPEIYKERELGGVMVGEEPVTYNTAASMSGRMGGGGGGLGPGAFGMGMGGGLGPLAGSLNSGFSSRQGLAYQASNMGYPNLNPALAGYGMGDGMGLNPVGLSQRFSYGGGGGGGGPSAGYPSAPVDEFSGEFNGRLVQNANEWNEVGQPGPAAAAYEQSSLDAGAFGPGGGLMGAGSGDYPGGPHSAAYGAHMGTPTSLNMAGSMSGAGYGAGFGVLGAGYNQQAQWDRLGGGPAAAGELGPTNFGQGVAGYQPQMAAARASASANGGWAPEQMRWQQRMAAMGPGFGGLGSAEAADYGNRFGQPGAGPGASALRSQSTSAARLRPLSSFVPLAGELAAASSPPAADRYTGSRNQQQQQQQQLQMQFQQQQQQQQLQQLRQQESAQSQLESHQTAAGWAQAGRFDEGAPVGDQQDADEADEAEARLGGGGGGGGSGGGGGGERSPSIVLNLPPPVGASEPRLSVASASSGSVALRGPSGGSASTEAPSQPESSQLSNHSDEFQHHQQLLHQSRVEFSRVGSAGYLGPELGPAGQLFEQEADTPPARQQQQQQQRRLLKKSSLENPAHLGKYIID